MAITMDAREAPRGPVLKGARDAAERARAFRRARRHSLLVKMLRVALPVAAAGIAGFYALTLGLSWQMGPGRLKVGEIEVTADDLTMKNPTYFGVTKDGGRYEVRAKKAVVEFNKEAPIKLIDIDGDLMQANDVVTKLKAKHGLLDNAKSELELYDGIEIDASNGMQARMSRAMVYSKEHRDRLQASGATLEHADRHGAGRNHDHAHRHTRGDLRRRREVHSRRTTPAQPAPSSPASGATPRQPVDVTAEQLYVNDTAKTALFMGSVVAVQGDSTLKAPELHIAYEGKAAASLTSATARAPSRPRRGLAPVAARGQERRRSSPWAPTGASPATRPSSMPRPIRRCSWATCSSTSRRMCCRASRLFVDRKDGKSRLETPAEGGQPAGRIAATFYPERRQGGVSPSPRSQPPR